MDVAHILKALTENAHDIAEVIAILVSGPLILPGRLGLWWLVSADSNRTLNRWRRCPAQWAGKRSLQRHAQCEGGHGALYLERDLGWFARWFDLEQ